MERRHRSLVSINTAAATATAAAAAADDDDGGDGRWAAVSYCLVFELAARRRNEARVIYAPVLAGVQ